MQLGLPEIAIIAAVVILLFGVGRIGKVGGELGKGIREFRTAIRDDETSGVTTVEGAKEAQSNQSA